ncbi:MAG: hypothetical protein MJE68_23630 [Proteobacteria bacterium]|nr:hypothetical protein [Pseudomonadota bacterium]
MANYLKKNMSDKSILLMSYMKLRLKMPPDADLEAKKVRLAEMAKFATSQFYEAAEPSIQISDGSIVIETIINGHLHELLSAENLMRLKLINAVEVVAGGLIVYGGLRSALSYLAKDIDAINNFSSHAARVLFGANLPEINSESRAGGIGYFQRVIEGIGVARTTTNESVQRAKAMKTAAKNADSLEKSTSDAKERKFLCQYLQREFKETHPMPITKQNPPKDVENAKKYNHYYEEFASVVERLCELRR